MAQIHCNVSNDKIPKEEWLGIEDTMHKLKCTHSGFLHQDKRLLDVITSDKLYLESVGISHEQIAGKLEIATKKFRHMFMCV